MKMNHEISLGLSLLTLWLLLSGLYTVLLVSLGLVSVVLVVYLANRMDVVDREGHPFHLKLMSIFGYWAWLLKEIVLANLDVSRRILHPDLPISPSIVRIQCTQPDDLGKVIYANSITLTPGTVSLEVDERGIEVHALSKEAAETLKKGEMDRRVTEMSTL